jgi:hypothetical protein
MWEKNATINLAKFDPLMLKEIVWILLFLKIVPYTNDIEIKSESAIVVDLPNVKDVTKK